MLNKWVTFTSQERAAGCSVMGADKLSAQGHTVNMFGFASLQVSVAMTLCCCNWKVPESICKQVVLTINFIYRHASVTVV